MQRKSQERFKQHVTAAPENECDVKHIDSTPQQYYYNNLPLLLTHAFDIRNRSNQTFFIQRDSVRETKQFVKHIQAK